MSVLARLLSPDVEAHLLVSEGEAIIDEVHKHWAATVNWHCLILASVPLFLAMIPARGLFWLPMLAGIAAMVMGIWKIHVAHMDRFVITNMRVFRVHGVFNQSLATMPMSRILDISMKQPLVGQLCGYGHFVFETAAQDQGLRVITFVGNPQERDLTIQRVIQRAGLRQVMKMDPPNSNEADGV